jgi:hypothetical protein
MDEPLKRAEAGVLGWIDRDITGPMADFEDPGQEWRRLFSGARAGTERSRTARTVEGHHSSVACREGPSRATWASSSLGGGGGGRCIGG